MSEKFSLREHTAPLWADYDAAIADETVAFNDLQSAILRDLSLEEKRELRTDARLRLRAAASRKMAAHRALMKRLTAHRPR
ncbi:hypothetical protein [Ramlibacter albus]|uniref:Uncharacterized protein n=1 Tax=Ramlibacter albus TaxID=2079448 RepID=A0A923M8K9_9BURK|nr:hypothetical protein [Ramlibacter albus]MBC5765813.1 hypothetical protein [Ramlibacter albus]